MADKSYFYVGSFDNAFHICSLDIKCGKIKYIRSIEHLKPAHMTVSADKTKLFITSEMFGTKGQLASYDISDPLKPVLISSLQLLSQGPCHIGLSEKEDFLIGGSYFEGNIEVYPVQNSGKLSERCFEYRSGTTGTAYAAGSCGQAVPRIHCVSVLKNTNYILATDYSGDQLINFEINKEGALRKKAQIQFSKGDAPRQIAVSPKREDIIYMVTEFSSKIYSVKVENESGRMIVMDMIHSLRSGAEALSASIHVSPDGRFLYISNRKEKNVSVILIEGNYEKLDFVGTIPDTGYVRDATLDPSGKYLVVGDLDNDLVRLYIRNQENGMCAPMASDISVSVPVSFLFI